MGKIILFLVMFVVVCLACVHRSQVKTNAEYAILYEENSASKKWATYLYRHLSKRAKGKRVLLNETDIKAVLIRVSVNENSSHDYCITQEKNEIGIMAKDERIMLWLVYQLIGNLSLSDKNIDATDIAPSIISLRDTCANFDFSYREPYFSPNLQFEHAPIIGTDMVETSWGLWGHGMNKIVEADPESAVYAVNNGTENKSQYCFSSTNLFRLTKSYIVDNFGAGDKQGYKFMFMPNDNKIACTCQKCVALGNTNTNATPSVLNFISRLATCYPKHTFFTTAYLTTETPPQKTLPANTGVVISTINLPKGIALEHSKELDKFMRLINSWKSKVTNVYVWDYAANFDDWMTPLPVLYALQKQLQFFKKQGVKGVFLNGSGYDYSPFDDLKTHVAALLMMDANASVDNLCSQYFAHFYPVSGIHLCNYYLALEQASEKANKPYGIYGGFEKSIIFDNPKMFVDFYEGLEPLINKALGEEKAKLQKLQTALSYTRLQLAISYGYLTYGFASVKEHAMVPHTEMELYIERLKRYNEYEDMRNYKEVNGLLDDFVKDVESKYRNPMKNLLIGTPLKALSALDDDYKNVAILQDGMLGYAKDYHHGWLIMSAERCKFQITTNADVRKGQNLNLHFLTDSKHNILPPSAIKIHLDGKKQIELFPKAEGDSDIVELSTKLNLSNTENITIEFVKQAKSRTTMACDEIIIN